MAMSDISSRNKADLVDMSRLKKSNDGTTFLLTVIDVFSKRAWCIPLKNKSAASLVAAFTQLLRERPPITLQTEKGSRVFEQIVTEVAKTVRRAPLFDAQRRNEGEHCREVQQDSEDTYVAIFHEEPVGSVPRRPTGL